MFPRSRRFSEKKVEPTPGPGQYDVKINAVKRDSIKHTIYTSPRFPEKCKISKTDGTKVCIKCMQADRVSKCRGESKCTSSQNSSMNSSINSCEDFNASFSPLSSKARNSDLRKSIRRSKQFHMTKDASVDLRQLIISKDNLAVEVDNDEPKKDPKYFEAQMQIEERAPSVNSDCPPPPYEEHSYSTQQLESPANSEVCCEFNPDGSQCQDYQRRIVALKIFQLENMMATNRAEMEKMQEIVEELSSELKNNVKI